MHAVVAALLSSCTSKTPIVMKLLHTCKCVLFFFVYRTKKKWKKLSTVHTGLDKANATEDIGMQDLASDHSSEAELHVLVGNEEGTCIVPVHGDNIIISIVLFLGDSTTLETAREHEKKVNLLNKLSASFNNLCYHSHLRA